MPDLRIEATVNGRRVARAAKPHQRLLDFLRDDLNLTGTKEGCGAGECGTCSVFVDGVLMKSCLMPVAKAQGADIETVEGLARSGELSVMQKAFHKTGASQCGYCIPGMVMAATAAIRGNPFVGHEEIKERLGGNICRCTGYQKIFDAVELARDVLNGRLPATALAEDEPEDGRFIGANVRRIDAPSKVSGALKYAGDMVMPGMLHMQVLRSPHPHARIVSIDTSDAEAMPGVEGVITCADVPGEDGFGVFVHDQPVMARGKVRYVGEAVAAVAAEDVLTARLALRQDQRAVRAAARGVRSGRGDAAGRARAARLRAGQRHQAHPDPRRRRRAGLCRVRPDRRGNLFDPAGRARLSRARGRPRLCRSRRRRDHRLAEPEHHPSPPHAGAHHRQADQQGALHHEAGRRRLRRQGGHDLSGHAGADGDEDAARRCASCSRARNRSSPPPSAIRRARP